MTREDNEIFPTHSQPGAAEARDGILLEFASFREFIDRYSAKISDEGLFIASEQPHAVGESVPFEVRLSDDFRLIQGRGTVVWQVPAGTPGHEAGMAIRFDQIDEPSRRLITRLVNNHRGEGGTVFDLNAPVEIAPASEQEPEASEELFVTDPRQDAPSTSPAGEAADDLFGESPFQMPAGPETIALPRDLIPSAQTTDLETLMDPESAAEPLHPLGPLAPPAPPAPPEATEPVQLPIEPVFEPEAAAVEPLDVPATPPADFVEATVSEIDEDFTQNAETEPAVLPEITPTEPAPFPVQPASPPVDPVGEYELPPVEIDPVVPASPILVPGPDRGQFPSPQPDRAADATVPFSGDGREIPLAPPEAILEPPGEPGGREPIVPELGSAPPTDEPSEGPVPTEVSTEISQVTREVTGEPMADVEMPEPGAVDDDYAASYAGSAEASSGSPGKWLWIGLCLVAIILGGVAAVRYQDRLRELMPWIPGGDPSVEVAAERPSLDELRARLLGEKEDAAPGDAAAPGEAGEAPEAATATAAGSATADAEATGGEDTAEAGPPTEQAEQTGKDGAETPLVAATEPGLDSPAEPVVTEVDPPSDVAAERDAPSVDGGTQPAGRVESIDWIDRDGSTIVTITTTGSLSRESFEHVRVAEGSPREVIKVFGVTEPFPSRVYEVGSDRVIRLRTGSHSGGEVHIVADLADGSVRMSGIDVAGKTLRVTFSR